MPIYYRRSIHLGPFRLNLSKSGIGYSLGSPLFRFGSGPRGTRISSSIPGTGIYYRKDYGRGISNRMSETEDLPFPDPKETIITNAILLAVIQPLVLGLVINLLMKSDYPLDPNFVVSALFLALLPTFGFGSRICYAETAKLTDGDSIAKRTFFVLGRVLEVLMITTLIIAVVLMVISLAVSKRPG